MRHVPDWLCIPRPQMKLHLHWRTRRPLGNARHQRCSRIASASQWVARAGWLCVLYALSGWALGQAGRSAQAPAALMPRGLLVYLEAMDLRGALARWNVSKEKGASLQSAHFEQFKNSKIYLKLASRLEQFSRSAGFEIDYARLSQYAGSRSALGLYNPSEMEFLFLTELSAAQRQATDLIRLRGRFQARQSSGLTYYINSEGGRTICYAETDPYFFLATQEDLLKTALALYRNPGSDEALSSDPDWREVSGTADFHDGQMYLAMKSLVRNINFKREWLFDNIDALSLFRAARIDLQWTDTQVKEYRTFAWQQAPAVPTSLRPMLVEKYAPNGYEYLAALSDPSEDLIAARLEEALINPLPSTMAQISRPRPLYGSFQSYALSRPRSAYERQIDDVEVPDETPQQSGLGPRKSHLFEVLSGAGLRSVVEIGRSQFSEEGFFLNFQRAFVLHGDADKLARERIRAAIEAEFKELYTAGGLGTNWQKRTLAGIEYDIFSSRSMRVATAQIGAALVLASPPEYMDRIIQTFQASLPPRFGLGDSGDTLVYFGAVDIKGARPNFTRLMKLLDYKESVARATGAAPLFFSQNLTSLLESLARLSRVTIERRYASSRLLETVTYSLEP